MIDRRYRSSWLVAFIDAILAYGYVIAATALPIGGTGPRTPWTYWITQPLVYVLILPIVIVAAWRGMHQVTLAWSGQPHWLRLTMEGTAIGVSSILLLSLVMHATFSDVLFGMIEAGLLAGGLGLLLTPINYGLVRVLPRPGTS